MLDDKDKLIAVLAETIKELKENIALRGKTFSILADLLKQQDEKIALLQKMTGDKSKMRLSKEAIGIIDSLGKLKTFH